MPWMRLGDLQQPARARLAHEEDPQGWNCGMRRVRAQSPWSQEAQGDSSQVRVFVFGSYCSFLPFSGGSRSTRVLTVVTSIARRRIWRGIFSRWLHSYTQTNNNILVSEYQIDMRVLNKLANSQKFWILSRLTSSGREAQHSEGCANNSDPSGERTPESDAGADCCRRTGAQLAQILLTLFVYHPFQLRRLKSRKKANWRATKSRLQLRWISSQIMQKFSSCVWDSCRSWFT